MTLSGRMIYFLARSLATKQGRIYVYGELKLELQSDLEALYDKRYRRTCDFILLLRREPINSRDMIEHRFESFDGSIQAFGGVCQWKYVRRRAAG